MANRKNDFSNLVRQVSSSRVGGLTFGKTVGLTNLIGNSQNAQSKRELITAPNDVAAVSIGAKVSSAGIQFGRPSNNKAEISQPSSILTNLLKQTVPGGISGALPGGVASFGGIGGIVSGIMNLFHHAKSAPQPLVEFQLPTPSEQTAYVSTGGVRHQQDTTEAAAKTSSSSLNGIYGTNSQTVQVGSGGGNAQYQGAEIARAVKTALLNSSSLGDVIAEI